MRKAVVLTILVCLLATVNLVLADTFGSGANQFTIGFATISGNASSANGTNISAFAPGDPIYKTFTDPGNYRMGTYEITNDQWNKFKATYGPVLGTPVTAYDRNSSSIGANVPTTNVSWYETAQFVNYLNTSSGYQAAYKFTGTQGTSSYTLGVWSAAEAAGGTNLYRNKNAKYFLPTENEWVKAAYWNGTRLQTYATIGNTIPVAGVNANYSFFNGGGQLWNVGTGSQELNGTFDMMGNVWEWTESPYYTGSYLAGSVRSFRGGAFTSDVSWIKSTGRYDEFDPLIQYNVVGFRVASIIPEPASALLMMLGTVWMAVKQKR